MLCFKFTLNAFLCIYLTQVSQAQSNACNQLANGVLVPKAMGQILREFVIVTTDMKVFQLPIGNFKTKPTHRVVFPHKYQPWQSNWPLLNFYHRNTSLFLLSGASFRQSLLVEYQSDKENSVQLTTFSSGKSTKLNSLQDKFDLVLSSEPANCGLAYTAQRINGKYSLKLTQRLTVENGVEAPRIENETISNSPVIDSLDSLPLAGFSIGKSGLVYMLFNDRVLVFPDNATADYQTVPLKQFFQCQAETRSISLWKWPTFFILFLCATTFAYNFAVAE